MGRCAWDLLVAAVGMMPVEAGAQHNHFQKRSYVTSVDQVEQMLQCFWVNLEVVATSRLDSLLRV